MKEEMIPTKFIPFGFIKTFIEWLFKWILRNKPLEEIKKYYPNGKLRESKKTYR